MSYKLDVITNSGAYFRCPRCETFWSYSFKICQNPFCQGETLEKVKVLVIKDPHGIWRREWQRIR